MTDFLFSHGPYLAYLGIAVFLMLTGAGLPVPEEVFIIAAGVAAAHGVLDPWLALLACLAGALAGDCVMYWIGYHFGRRVLREHHWWTRFIHPEREARMEQMIHRHGLKVFFLARFLVGIRAPVYLSAGVLHVRFRRFMLIDLFSASMVIGTFFGLSYFLSDRYGKAVYRWIREAEVLLTVVVVLVGAGVAFYYWRRHRRIVAAAAAEADEQTAEAPEQPEDAEESVSEIERIA
ncbi:MAG: VTT domain-containing protein [Pirellulales bacterium]|nr:VTT domain-containing protein [Pirellulales bacterium]